MKYSLYDRVIIFGASSSIASFLIPHASFPPNKTTLVYRQITSTRTSFDSLFKSVEFDIGAKEFSIEILLKSLDVKLTEKILIINLVGDFGTIQNMKSHQSDSVLRTINSNLGPFLNLIYFLSHLGSGSMLIGFSGGGIGGPSLESSSLGYLASKGSMGFIAEAISPILAIEGKSICLIAPGAYPSKMQKLVAENPYEEFSSNRTKAAGVRFDQMNLQKLSKLIYWLINNPKKANGRIWSALHDEPAMGEISSDHGFLRRIY